MSALILKRNGKYKTGFCGIKCCEGSNPKNVFGHPLPTCTQWQSCSCQCHVSIDKMFELSGMDRIAVDNSTYIPDRGDFVMPSLEELAIARVSSNSTLSSPPERIESPLPDTVPATIARTYTPTPTGRAARGELEFQVKWATDRWTVDAPAEPCTPKWISEEVGRHFGIKNPSVGAIDAVFNRWVSIGFAVIEKKPTRFTRYTEDGIKFTLEGCKQRAKRKKIR